jgi:NAD(P)H-dependent flavin oxidoreductase YrpB (nitropropane dioxygenase family)
VDADDVSRFIDAGAAGVQLATRFLACSDGDVHPNFKAMHLGKKAEDVAIITSCVKGMKARAVRNAFTDTQRLHRPACAGRGDPAAREGLVVRP